MTGLSRVLFVDEIPRGRPLYVYGTGSNGRTLRAILAAAQIDEVVAFIDTEKSGIVDGLRCFSVDEYAARRGANDLVLLASAFAAEMREALLKRGVAATLEATHVWSVLLHRELATQERFFRLHQTPGVAFDVGANAGFVSRLLRRRASEVHAFEPNENLRPQLDFSFAGFGGMHVVPVAVSDREGTATLRVSADHNSTQSSLSADLAQVAGEVAVRTTTIDAYCRATGVVPRTIKVDVESHEPAVISGGWETISRHRPLMLIEFQESAADREYRDMLAELSKLYRIVRIPALDDPDYSGLYVDAVAYYRDHDPTGVTNLGCLPLSA
ncbi:MAG: hypothetical protein JWM77_2193 [Rhodospirillales bacterium]|nr:hypothetical protein [Rhodospirillales bacterium]